LSGCVILAGFQVKPGCLDVFLAPARDDARRSRLSKPGGRRFEVAGGENGRVRFHERHDDRAACDAHLGTPDLARCRAGDPAPLACFRAGYPALTDRLRGHFASLQAS